MVAHRTVPVLPVDLLEKAAIAHSYNDIEGNEVAGDKEPPALITLVFQQEDGDPPIRGLQDEDVSDSRFMFDRFNTVVYRLYTLAPDQVWDTRPEGKRKRKSKKHEAADKLVISFVNAVHA